jgi:hypothetical protein
MKLRSARRWLDGGEGGDWRRTAMIGAGAVIGGLGLAWAARRMMHRL